MSDQKVKLDELLERWKNQTTGSLNDMFDEMSALMAEAVELGISAQEFMQRKDKVLNVWVALTWHDAQKRSEKTVTDDFGNTKTLKWTNKAWWQNRKDSALRIYGKLYRDHFGSVAKPEKSAAPVRQPLRVVSGDEMPVFTTAEEFRAFKAKRNGGSTT